MLSKNITQTGIKVAFIDNDGKKVGGITVDQANKVAEGNPNKRFYFQNGNGIEEELTIDQVNQLTTVDLLPSAPECNTGPQVCGPPLVKFFGGNGGYGAAANAIISPISSSVIGFDIVDSGFGFLGTPSAELIDPCGKGSGSSLQVNMIDDDVDTSNIDPSTQSATSTNISTINGGTATAATTEGDLTATAVVGGTATNINANTNTTGGTAISSGETAVIENDCNVPREQFEKIMNRILGRSKKIKNITILAPGDGYLSTPDGSLGGNERVWKEPDEGYVKTKCGGYYVVQPYRPIKVSVDDVYYAPNEPPRKIETDEVITLPLVAVTPPSPTTVGLTYPVILVIDEILVLDPGYNYLPGDKLIIDPDFGAEAELVVNDGGQIDSVNIIKSGVGFLDLPSLRTNSVTGFNATFSVILKPIRIDLNRPLQEQIDQVIPQQIELISVIDCVGKVV